MRTESFFEWLGQLLGSIIRTIVDALEGFFDLIASAGHNFLEGLSGALGMDHSLLSLVALVLGLWLLFSAVRAFMRRSFISGLIWLLLGLWLMSWLIR
ncbi:hypothetical protein [Stutzerimonas kirkiae]|uniref:Uncharacterized protein n=1 Tax=Stutzerimonas kirkiae TaxID=2211392 RepID=A0A4Q9RDL2_9GAMM|nr:hypothetical protein [Stutzerimonas kirkiae]TBU99796.1 hypothetical protein DNJ96_00385 [Stutzerimonas kirkiae]TBV05272.1 hypothetical protein DNJ95_03410 [Stutzerimonas kirkiae]TBV11706.1 hypothetical protein DNK08_01950 [Stutzerimonas kirkiae]TBV15365.1 hypothetical protein DNK01_06725 [Stutzerimonas kirkiae]